MVIKRSTIISVGIVGNVLFVKMAVITGTLCTEITVAWTVLIDLTNTVFCVLLRVLIFIFLH
jgi:hypothetical protein